MRRRILAMLLGVTLSLSGILGAFPEAALSVHAESSLGITDADCTEGGGGSTAEGQYTAGCESV